jgi:hypothetical protein
MCRFISIIIAVLFFLPLIAQTDSFAIGDERKADTLLLRDSATLSPSNSHVRIVLQQGKSSSWFKDILPILTLILGIGIKEVLDKRRDKKQMVSAGEHWVAELELLREPLVKQVQYLQEFLAQHKEDTEDIPQITVQAAVDGTSFDALDRVKLIQYLEKQNGKSYKESIAIAKKVYSFITVLKTNYQDLKDRFKEYLRGREKHHDTVNKGLQNLVIQFGEYQVEIEKETNGNFDLNPGFVKLYDLFMSEIRPYMDSGNFDIFKMELDFLKQLTAILGEMRMDARLFPMHNSCQQMMNGIKGIKAEKHYLNTNLNTMLGRYEESLKGLDKLILLNN